MALLARAAVGKDEASATVLILLTEADVDGLLSLTEGHGAAEDALLVGLLRDGTLCTLGGVSAIRNSGALVILHHALCAVLVILHEDLGGAGRLVAVGDGVMAGHGLIDGVVEGGWVTGTLVGCELLGAGVVDVNITQGLELLLERVDGHAHGRGGRRTGGHGNLGLGEGRGSNLCGGEHAVNGEGW